MAESKTTGKKSAASSGAIMKTISARRSIRNFDPGKPVEEEKLAVLLEAARLAPSSNNTQPWHFVVVRNEEMRDALSKAAPLGTATNKWMRNAPVIIVCCGQPNLLLHKSVGQVFDKDFFKIDIAIAVEHIVLAAREMDLGTCWVGWFDERKVRSLLRIPSSTRVLALLPVGYPRGEWPAARKRNKMDEIVSYERYGNKEAR